ncbi:rhodanese-like domain-containing protein [Candidatus Sumerlaeota bacterium]|nr:rhodanese-like domain-containing protein [Candidatus Sumerlaeota bacterium]
MSVWLKRCGILLAISAALAAVDSVARPTAWTVTSVAGRNDAPPDQATGSPAVAANSPGPSVQPTTPAHTAQWFSDQLSAGAIAIDARPEEKFRESHIPGAIHLPFEAFTKGRPDAIDFLPDDGTTLIIYCDGGDCDASHKVQTMLAQFGLKDTIVFEDGFPGWQKAGLPIETGAAGAQ